MEARRAEKKQNKRKATMEERRGGKRETKIKEGVSRKLRSEKTDNEIRWSLAKMLIFLTHPSTPAIHVFGEATHRHTEYTYIHVSEGTKEKKKGWCSVEY